jgi:hypothetical protein
VLNWKRTNRYELRMQKTLNLIFRKHPALVDSIFDKERPRLRCEPERILMECGVFSSGEKILIRVALDLWNGSGGVSLWDVVERLDVDNYRNVLRGLLNLRQIDDEEMGIVWRQPKTACALGGSGKEADLSPA